MVHLPQNFKGGYLRSVADNNSSGIFFKGIKCKPELHVFDAIRLLENNYWVVSSSLPLFLISRYTSSGDKCCGI